MNCSKNTLKVIFFEAGCSGGSVNRLLKLMEMWDYELYPAGVFTFYKHSKAFQLLNLKGPSFAKTLGYTYKSFPDPLFVKYGLVLPTVFGVRYFVRSFITLLQHNSSHIYINNTPYSHIPLIVAAIILKKKIICHLRDTIELTRIEKKILNYIDLFVSLSEAAKNHYIRQGIKEDKIRVIYDSIDVKYYMRSSDCVENSKNNDLKIVVVGSLVYRKAQDVCIKALNIIVNKHNNVKMVFVGDGEYRQELEKMVTCYNLTDKVTFEGHSESIPKILQNSDIGVLVSRREGLPNSVMEYMAAGLPVVVAELPGMRELVIDRHTGYIINQESYEELADKLIELIQNRDLRYNMGKAGLLRVMSTQFAPSTELNEIISTLSC